MVFGVAVSHGKNAFIAREARINRTFVISTEGRNLQFVELSTLVAGQDYSPRSK
jgi:hypothetical protein